MFLEDSQTEHVKYDIGGTMVQAVSSRPLTTEARVRARV
jgi:hypothetical protein